MARKGKDGRKRPAQPPPSKFGKYTPDQFKKHLDEFEALYGSQKEAAKKFGVDVSTYRAYKTGKRTPPKDFAQKANRVYGRNRDRIAQAEVQSKVKRRTETKSKKSQATTAKYSTVTMSVREWVRSQFDETTQEHFIITALDALGPFVAFPRGDPDRVQFWDGFSPFGKPKGQKAVTVWAIYHSKYQLEAGDDEAGSGSIYGDPFPILIDMTKAWDVSQTLSYLESKLMNHERQVGRRRYNLTRFIGYELR